MSNDDMFLTPVGRMVMGSLYDPQTTDIDGKPLTFNSGKNEGKPRVNYFFALAIKKNGEQHWNQTEWGAKIYSTANALYLRGETQRPGFSWKISDGDSEVPNKKGIRPCDCEAHPGHWIIKFGSAYAPVLVDKNGDYLTKENAINCGDYIQVNCTVRSNRAKPTANIGIVLSATHVALIGYGEPIEFKAVIEPKALGFSKELPPGASLTPVPRSAPVASAPTVAPVTPAPTVVPAALPVPPPYPEILTPGKKMTGKSAATYEQMIAAGWSDEQLIAHGYMTL